MARREDKLNPDYMKWADEDPEEFAKHHPSLADSDYRKRVRKTLVRYTEMEYRTVKQAARRTKMRGVETFVREAAVQTAMRVLGKVDSEDSES
jgi:hypothetical protein